MVERAVVLLGNVSVGRAGGQVLMMMVLLLVLALLLLLAGS